MKGEEETGVGVGKGCSGMQKKKTEKWLTGPLVRTGEMCSIPGPTGRGSKRKRNEG